MAQNEIQKYTFSAVPTGGSWKPAYNGNASSGSMADVNTGAELSGYLEQITGIDSQLNVSCGGSYASGMTVEFVGALANTDMLTLGYQDNTLAIAVTDLGCNVVQEGGGGNNETQDIGFNASTGSGSVDISWSGYGTITLSYNGSGLQSALDTVFGSGNATGTVNGAGNWTITFGGSLADTDIPTPTFPSSSLAIPVSISVEVIQEGEPSIQSTPVVSLTRSTDSIVENGGTASVIATLDATASATVDVVVQFAGSASTGSDYTLSTTTISIASGNTSGSLTATAISDLVYEGDETFTASIASVSGGGASIGSASYASVTIIDDESPPVVNLSASTTSIVENVGRAYVVFRLANASYQDVTIGLGFSGSATLNTDYSASSNSLIVAAGGTSGSISVTAIQDSTYEGNETILVGITSVTNGSAGATNSLSITLVDDDPAPPVVSLTSSLTSIDENAGSAIVRALMSATHSATVTVTLGFAGTATNTTDYTRTTDAIVMTSGQTSGSIGITSIQDTLSESNETIVISIASITSGISSSSDTITITIVNEGAVTNEVGMASTKRSLVAKNAPPIDAVVSCGVVTDWIDVCTAPEAADNSGSTVTSPGSISRTDQRWMAVCALGTQLLVRLKYDAAVTSPTSPAVQLFGKDSQGSILPLVDGSGTHAQALTIDLTNDVTDGTYKYTTAKTLNIAGCKDVLAAIKTAFAGTGTVNNSAIQVRVI